MDYLADKNIQTTANIICLGDQFTYYEKSQFGVQVKCKNLITGEELLDEIVIDPKKTSREDAEEILLTILSEIEKIKKESKPS